MIEQTLISVFATEQINYGVIAYGLVTTIGHSYALSENSNNVFVLSDPRLKQVSSRTAIVSNCFECLH